MSDDLDNLLRRAMKTLEDQVPPGYLEDFPSRTLARLEDGSVHDEPLDEIGAAGSSELIPAGTAAAPAVAAPAPAAAEPAPPAKPREEDSGLHDIRNLASSQRMRLSSKRSSQGPIRTDDDVLASASGSWRAVALPEPAMMVALPEPPDLTAPPPASEGKAAKSKAAKPKAAEPGTAAAAKGTAKTAGRSREAAAAVEQPAQVTPITAGKPRPEPAAPSSGKRGAMIAAAGLGLAAAAGVVFFVSTQRSKSDDAAREAAAPAGQSSMQLPELQRVQPPAPAAIAAPDPAATAGSAAPAAAAPAEQPADKGKAADVAPAKPSRSIGKYVPNVEDTPGAPDKKDDAKKKKPEPGDPDFDKLLKEAGYQEKQAEAPKLDKKSLSGDDIKKSMNAVASKVASCYAGEQGTAAVRLTVAPTGQIQKVTVTGEFAGTPVGACVEGAVQLATFPPWDGGPQSVNYSYLLAE